MSMPKLSWLMMLQMAFSAMILRFDRWQRLRIMQQLVCKLASLLRWHFFPFTPWDVSLQLF